MNKEIKKFKDMSEEERRSYCCQKTYEMGDL